MARKKRGRLQQFEDLSPFERAAALQELSELKDSTSEHAAQIARALKDESAWVRAAASEALGKMGALAEPHAALLGDLLHGEADRGVRLAAAKALLALGTWSAPAVDALARAVANTGSIDNPYDCLQVEFLGAAMRCLGKIGQADHASVLVDKLQHHLHLHVYSPHEVGALALAALGDLGVNASEEAARAVAEAVVDKSVHQDLRVDAMSALGKFGKVGIPFSSMLTTVIEDIGEPCLLREKAATALEALKAAERVRILTCTATLQADGAPAIVCTNLAAEEVARIQCEPLEVFASVRKSLAEALGNPAHQLCLLQADGSVIADNDVIQSILPETGTLS